MIPGLELCFILSRSNGARKEGFRGDHRSVSGIVIGERSAQAQCKQVALEKPWISPAIATCAGLLWEDMTDFALEPVHALVAPRDGRDRAGRACTRRSRRRFDDSRHEWSSSSDPLAARHPPRRGVGRMSRSILSVAFSVRRLDRTLAISLMLALAILPPFALRVMQPSCAEATLQMKTQ